MDFWKQQMDKFVLLIAILFFTLLIMHLHREEQTPAIHDISQFFIATDSGFVGALLRALTGPERALKHPNGDQPLLLGPKNEKT